MIEPQPTLFNFVKKAYNDSEPGSNVQISLSDPSIVLNSWDLLTRVISDALHEINLSPEKNYLILQFFWRWKLWFEKKAEEDKINLATKHIIQNDDFVTPFLQRKYE